MPWLAVINRRPYPTPVTGAWDFAGLLLGLSGFLLFGGGLLLGLVQSNARFAARGNFEAFRAAWDRERLVWLIGEAGLSVRQALRQKDTPYDALGLANEALTDDQLLDAMIEHPILINRPFVVTAKGTLRWGREGLPVTLDEFLRRLRMLHDQHPGADAPVLVRGEAGAAFPAVAWVVDEASKSEIKDIAIASAAKPPPGDNWFHSSPPGPRRPKEPNAPPTSGQ